MTVKPWIERMLEKELGSMYGKSVWDDLQDNLRLYAIYDGSGQMWEVADNLDYKPTRRITNHTQHLIKEEARFMFSRAPEINIKPLDDDDANKERCEALEDYVSQALTRSKWQASLTQAGRDCFIGKRVALKVCATADGPVALFRPSLEFFTDVENDDTDRMTKAIFFYSQNAEKDEARQRIWVQRYFTDDGGVYLSETVYDGRGVIVERRRDGERLPLDRIPVYPIINDGLTGDTIGQSDVTPLVPLQDAYNRMTSDDQDALRFCMFPQTVFTDAAEKSLEAIKVAPKAMIDLQTEPTAVDVQAKAGILESGFSYDGRLEHALERVKSDMYEILSVPKATIEDYKGMQASGKALKALYWPLISRCEEKWATWDTALKWMVDTIAQLAAAYGGGEAFCGARYKVEINHLYPITDDEEEERALDLREVSAKARSRKSYIEKWQRMDDADDEIEQLAKERTALEESYMT